MRKVEATPRAGAGARLAVTVMLDHPDDLALVERFRLAIIKLDGPRWELSTDPEIVRMAARAYMRQTINEAAYEE